MKWLRSEKKKALFHPAAHVNSAREIERPKAPSIVRAGYRFADKHIRVAAVGDLHGRVDLLKQIAERLDELALDQEKKLVEIYLGDYVDRGGNPKATLEFLIDRRKKDDRQVICLAGNHEKMLLEALEDDASFIRWLKFGGQPTLISYGISPLFAESSPSKARQAFLAELTPEHVEFLRSLPLRHDLGGFCFVHAGLRPGIALMDQSERDMLWIRSDFLQSASDFGAIVIHGHTPTATVTFRPNRIGVDTGAYGSGVLTCLLITSEGITVSDTNRRPIGGG